MSMGYSGYADLQQFDETLVIYLYCCYNANDADYKRFKEIEDGELYIDRNAFVEPDIHEKIRKTASGKKKTAVRRIKNKVDFDELFESGKIKVKNASGTWSKTEFGIDIMAVNLLRTIFDEYQQTGELPKRAVWFC